MINKKIDQILKDISQAFEAGTLHKIRIANKRNRDQDIFKVDIKMVQLKKGKQLSFVYKHPTKDETKNYTIDDSIHLIKSLLTEQFSQAIIFLKEEDIHYTIHENGKEKIKRTIASIKEDINLEHDHQKKRYLTEKSTPFLYALGVSTHSGQIKKDKQKKFRQINRFIEIIDAQKKSLNDKELSVVDFGSGMGYLSFALYDYLTHRQGLSTQMVGIELRKELVDKCNQISKEINFNGLSFTQGLIEKYPLKHHDITMALHACDTATDDAIAYGIKSNSKLIILSPCCHKQIRKQLNPTLSLHNITQFGILKERQAEILTDTIRALILESFGYKTQVIEYISSEHTAKNLLIIASQIEKRTEANSDLIKEIQSIKSLFGIEKHALEEKLEM